MTQLNLLLHQMRQALIKTLKSFISLLLCVSLFSCKPKEYITTYDYLKELSYKTGITLASEKDNILSDLREFGIYKESDNDILDRNLTYKYMLDSILVFNEGEIVDLNYDDEDFVTKEDAYRFIDKLTSIINNKSFETIEYHEYKPEVKENLSNLQINDIYFDENNNVYKRVVDNNGNTVDASFEEIFEELKISSSEEINFDESIIIDDEGSIEETVYDSENYNLLSTKRHVINQKGYRISYKITSGVIDFRISKDSGVNSYVDFSLSNIKPSYKWDYKDGKINEAYFKVDYRLSSEVGVSKGKKQTYILDLSNLDTSSLLSTITSSLKKQSKDVEATIKICTIKTPIPGIPLAFINVDVLARVYIDGKIDIVATMNNTTGFEVINNKFRFINDGKQDIDFNIEASARAVAGVNFNIEAAKFRLMDLEVTAGVKASCKPIVHLYDHDGNMTTNEVDLDLEELEDVASKNDNVKVCADVSLNWILNVDVNTSKSLLYKFGLSRSKEILNKKNQILGNMTHIENGHFVKTCTRKPKNYSSKEINSIDVNKILLEKYSVAINQGEKYLIPIKGLPNGYSNNDLLITSSDPSIASINNLYIIGNKVGSTKITIETKDSKYKAYINVLISTG